MTIYDSRDSAFKEPFGAVRTGETCTIRVRLDPSLCAHEVQLLLTPWGGGETRAFDLWYDGEDASGGVAASVFQTRFTIDAPWVYFYRFRYRSGGRDWFICRGADNRGVIAADAQGEAYRLTVYDAAMETPEAGTEICYNAWPDGFCRSGKPKQGIPEGRAMRANRDDLPRWEYGKIAQDYWGGDLAGIAEKLDYLAGLGVTLIYLNPICAAHSNHRYNAADYEAIDPLLGDWDDLRALCHAARDKGIRIVFDGVFNHVGSDSIYFNKEGRYGTVGAYNSKESTYYGDFLFRNWPDDYECWWGDKSLPALNKQSAQVVARICGTGGVIDRYFDAGVSGVRLDVADELPDALLDDIRTAVKRHGSDKLVIGEVWEDATLKESYSVRRRYLLGAQLDGVMNYPFRDAMYAYLLHGDAARFAETTLSIVEQYPPCTMRHCWTITSGHDDARMISVLGMDGEVRREPDRAWERAHDALTPEQYALGKARAQVMAVLQYFLPGVPMLYYGNEAGVCGFLDPFNRKPYPWGAEDAQLVSFYRALGDARQSLPMLGGAGYRIALANERVLAFERTWEDGGVLVAVNRTADPQPFTLPAPYANGRELFAIGQDASGGLAGFGARVVTAPCGEGSAAE